MGIQSKGKNELLLLHHQYLWPSLSPSLGFRIPRSKSEYVSQPVQANIRCMHPATIPRRPSANASVCMVTQGLHVSGSTFSGFSKLEQGNNTTFASRQPLILDRLVFRRTGRAAFLQQALNPSFSKGKGRPSPWTAKNAFAVQPSLLLTSYINMPSRTVTASCAAVPGSSKLSKTSRIISVTADLVILAPASSRIRLWMDTKQQTQCTNCNTKAPMF